MCRYTCVYMHVYTWCTLCLCGLICFVCLLSVLFLYSNFNDVCSKIYIVSLLVESRHCLLTLLESSCLYSFEKKCDAWICAWFWGNFNVSLPTIASTVLNGTHVALPSLGGTPFFTNTSWNISSPMLGRRAVYRFTSVFAVLLLSSMNSNDGAKRYTFWTSFFSRHVIVR